MATEKQLNELLLHWNQLRQDGQVVSAEELCAEKEVETTPELIENLERRMHEAGMMDGLLGGPDSDTHTLQRSDHAISTWDELANGSPTQDEVIFSVGQYDYFRFLAKGGVGEVYRAGDKEFGREVALKFIQRVHEKNPESKSQFIVEGEVTARLEHPGVVPIYGFGYTSDGRPFHVMRLIRGETLGDRIDAFHSDMKAGLDASERRMRFHKLLSQFVSVCNTIGYAHNRGIMHRDIKPDNIMLGKYGETLVVDWGLAKPVERDERAKASGEMTLRPGSGDTNSDLSTGVVGTPSYMSPEQATGRNDIGPAADIYSLGATLYKIVTGETAIQGTHLRDILEKVKAGKFQPPREVTSHVSRSMEAICLRAMALEADDRYDTALELAADVERWLADEPVSACKEPWYQRLRRWTRRHRGVTQIIAATLLIVVVASTAWVTSRVNQRAEIVQQRLKDLSAKADTEETLLQFGFSDLAKDVRLLATLPQVEKLVEKLALLESDQQLTDTDKLPVENVFSGFLGLNPNYMQARLLDENGIEVVRMHRAQPGGTIEKAKELQDKSKKTYFTNTKAITENEIYLSKLELNIEQGKKQWDFPVIRAAVPLFSNSQEFAGVVIINMHFRHLADMVRRSEGAEMLVYLTNSSGEFLLHPVERLNFCFERKLDFTIADTYPRLATFFRSRTTNNVTELTRVEPGTAVLLEVTDESDDVELNDVVLALQKNREDLRVDFSEDEKLAVVTNVEHDQLDEMLQLIRSRFGSDVKAQPLPTRYRGAPQAVYCRKIFFDQRDPSRFINLVLVLPY